MGYNWQWNRIPPLLYDIDDGRFVAGPLLLGAGELGKEVAIELQRYAVEVIAVDRYANAPAMQVASGTQVSWTCNVTNPSMTTELTFGESANTNDMCIFDGQYYPADDSNPTIQCMR